ncbi:MAG: hypothetical protein GEU99_22235 [Luteitalea sp.]|nr:hypothetical protein [Luteitalea sp.]
MRTGVIVRLLDRACLVRFLALAAKILASALALPACGAPVDRHPAAAVFPPDASSKDLPALLEATAFVRGLEDPDLVSLVPEQAGLRFVGCPNCNSGRQEGQLAWTPQRPGEVYCRYCNHRYPSDKYPMNLARTPRFEEPRKTTQDWKNSSGRS